MNIKTSFVSSNFFPVLMKSPISFFYLVPGASNNGGEDSPGGVITGKAGLAHAGAIVNDKSGNVLVTHDGSLG